jgi:hypothetical protein
VAGPAEPLAPDAIARLLEATLTTVHAELGALGDPEAGWRPAPGEWSANEVVGHLVEAERRGFAGRIRIILANDRPTLEPWDQPAVAAARHDQDRRAADLVAEFSAARRDAIDLVRSLTPPDLARVGLHPQVGELSVADLLGEWVHHDRNHVRQLLANAQDRVWPQMGNARRFSAID